MGFDDWPVMLLMALQPGDKIQKEGMTVSGDGLARCPVAASNAKKILKLIDRDAIKVSRGSKMPMDGYVVFPKNWRDGGHCLSPVLKYAHTALVGKS